MNENKWLKESSKWVKDLEEKKKKKQQQEQFQAWGKLGGRPRKNENKKSEKFLLSLTKEQRNRLLEISNSYGIKPQEWLRYIILNEEPKDAERNKVLMKYRANFIRISNHFRSNVWLEEEREKYRHELSKVIELIENELKK